MQQLGRRRGRILAFQALFAWDCTKGLCDIKDDLLLFNWSNSPNIKAGSKEGLLFPRMLFLGTIENIDEIDTRISAHLEHWDLQRVNGVDRAILRLSAYTLLFQKDISPSIVIDEAIGLAKKFGTDESFKFVNAVLDSLHKAA